ncbi:MAG: epoxyqueuosine reductase QueH [Candidatus Omnitrophota bacterium]
MKILLHICCAPCLIHPLEVLRKKGFSVTGLFFNPNIHPLAEFHKRYEACKIFTKDSQLECLEAPYDPRVFFRAINPVRDLPNLAVNVDGNIQSQPISLSLPLNSSLDSSNRVNEKEETPGRCLLCWRLRLKKTAKIAKDKGFGYFTTTLLGSPYQDTKAIERIGQVEADAFGLVFLVDDFKTGFRAAHRKAKESGMYCQRYCGCIYSEIERDKSRHK